MVLGWHGGEKEGKRMQKHKQGYACVNYSDI